MERIGEMSELKHLLRYSIKEATFYDALAVRIDNGEYKTGIARYSHLRNEHILSLHFFLLQTGAQNISTGLPALYNDCSLDHLIESVETFDDRSIRKLCFSVARHTIKMYKRLLMATHNSNQRLANLLRRHLYAIKRLKSSGLLSGGHLKIS